MKKITLTLQNVDVQIIKFVNRDAYEDFGEIEGRSVENVNSEFDEVDRLRARKPIAFFKQNDGSYVLITQKTASVIEKV